MQDDLISFLSYVKTEAIPILPVTKPDIRTVLGQGATFLVNGAEVPEDYTDPVSGTVFPQGMIVALKRAVLNADIGRIPVIFNELLTMHHPPLRAHPNIVKLLGVGFEVEGPPDAQSAIPVLIPECAELGNLAEILETARKEDRPLSFDEKLSLCLDIAHGLEILHRCDIVHGDVKCENVLIFEHEDSQRQPQSAGGFRMYCKLTDFGVLRHPESETGVLLGGSRPWQAPECSRGHFFEVEEAKRTDVYSFGMLLWRVFLDGDPFKLLEESKLVVYGEDESPKQRRLKRNDTVARLKDDNGLVGHVCESLALSCKFSRSELEMLCDVIGITLVNDASRRELSFARIIRLLSPNQWFQPRTSVQPARMPLHVDAHLLDLEKWHSEFDKASPVVLALLASGFRDYAEGKTKRLGKNPDERRSAAAHQLAMCYANGFGVSFDAGECMKWMIFAAEKGSHKAEEAIPKLSKAFGKQHKALFLSAQAQDDDAKSALSSSWASDFPPERSLQHTVHGDPLISASTTSVPVKAGTPWSFLSAAENCRYDVLKSLLASSSKPGASEDGVSPLHFLSMWDIEEAEKLGLQLIQAGADVNANAKRGSTVGGTPLMWSVYGNHLEHSEILIKLGADPMTSLDGDDALTFAARLHLTMHLRMLLENLRPAQVRGNLRRLIEATAGGESRFTRMIRHQENWQSAGPKTLLLLKQWNDLFSDATDFNELLLPAIQSSLSSEHGRMNAEVQLDFIERHQIDPLQMNDLLRQSVISFNDQLFDGLLDYGVRAGGTFEKKQTLLHLCAKIPDHSLAATAFAPRLFDLGAELDVQDEDGVTPWMRAILERKWDLADLLMRKGAKPLVTNKDGFNVLGLCILAINLGSIKYLMKYCAEKVVFHQDSFLVSPDKQISALQLAASLSVPRAHGMKLEVIGTFLTVLANYAREPWQLNYRSSGILPNATALDIAVSKGNLHAVKNLVKKGAHKAPADRASALVIAKAELEATNDWLRKKNLERCMYIIENWDESKTTRQLADDWTNMRTIDESHVKSSWEILIWHYKTRPGAQRAA
ncbi:hypothetical protein MMC21_004341 [Puttea exsequens]|nr:hypothetical protein [Puttea exsequens]